jgi:hypothetical protein
MLILDPFIEKINSKLETYSADNSLTKDIISRFDEVLLEKASKFSIEQVYETLGMYINHATFENFKEECQKSYKNTFEQINNFKELMREAKVDIMKDIDEHIK